MVGSKLIPVLLMVSGLALLCGCNAGSDGQSDAVTLSGQSEFSIPPVLRKVPAAGLSAAVSVGGIETIYSSADFPDGRWLVDVTVRENQMHNIVVKWFSLTHLVLEETGRFYADSGSPVIRPEMDYVSAGYARFDSDCDGKSNLDEIIDGTDVSVAEGTAGSACPGQVTTVDLNETEYGWVVRQLKKFRTAGLPDRATSFEQLLQVRTISPDLRSSYRSTISTESDDSVITNVELVYDPVIGKRLRFRANRGISAQPSDAQGARCNPYGIDDGGYACIVPYDWQEQRWYRLKFEEISATTWQGSVTDTETGLSEIIATIDFEPGINWLRAQNGLSYSDDFPSENCRLGLPFINMRYRPAMVNGSYELKTLHTVKSDCVKAGAGWAEGVRTTDGVLEYSLSLGQSQ